jgi:hypothetical protein
MPHKFKVGDPVALKPAPSLNVPGGLYEVVKQLPINQGEYEYRIMSTNTASRAPTSRISELLGKATCGRRRLDFRSDLAPLLDCAPVSIEGRQLLERR